MSIISLIVTLVILGLIYWLVLWFLRTAAVPEPFNKVATVLLALVIVLYLIGVLLGRAPAFPVAQWRL